MEEYYRCKVKITKVGIYPVIGARFTHVKPKDDYTLYILKDDKNFIYVGITKQSVRARFGGSFYAFKNKKAKTYFNGYTGYKWIEEYQKSKKHIDLIVIPLGIDKKMSEAIEAEVVYLIRNNTGKWPLFQHEIHFHNNSEAERFAKNIFTSVC